MLSKKLGAQRGEGNLENKGAAGSKPAALGASAYFSVASAASMRPIWVSLIRLFRVDWKRG
jgi:hypothetical protein